jgi:hypothetical protein
MAMTGNRRAALEYASLLLVSAMAIVAWRRPLVSGSAERPLFRTSESCLACHNGLITPAGEDVSIGSEWRATMMANSSRDPYWQASVRREIIDHPESRAEIEDECATCHMPMARYEDKTQGLKGEVFARLTAGGPRTRRDSLAIDGVSCALCHQVTDEKLGTPASFVGGFVVDVAKPMGERAVFGPFEVDTGRTAIMHSASEFVPTEGKHIQKAEMCATCHTLTTTARGAGGRVIGHLHEQVPYQEWKQSRFASGSDVKTCQNCHMPAVTDSMAVSSVWGARRPGLARHEFVGGNFFMLRMLDRNREALGVEALSEELQRGVKRTVELLATSTARVRVENGRVVNGRLEAEVVLENLAGHKLPTGYPSRRTWLHVTVTDEGGAKVFESGAIGADGAIAGNDNDTDGAIFEPHYREVTRADQVQIYESMMVDAAGRPTTGLISGVRFAKDNRLLPQGFDKRAADSTTAIIGDALADADFIGGGDRVRYLVDVSRARAGALRVEVEVLYQPIAFRWAKNLGTYDAAEAKRFAAFYDALANEASTVLARGTVTVR